MQSPAPPATASDGAEPPRPIADLLVVADGLNADVERVRFRDEGLTSVATRVNHFSGSRLPERNRLALFRVELRYIRPFDDGEVNDGASAPRHILREAQPDLAFRRILIVDKLEIDHLPVWADLRVFKGLR